MSSIEEGTEKGPPAQDLEVDVPLSPEAVEKAQASRATPVSEGKTPAEEAREEIVKNLAKQTRQDTFWRRFVFWGVVALIGVGYLFSGIILGVYFFAAPSNADPVVLATWFSASVVQTIGLLAIITKSLFPDRAGGGDPAEVVAGEH